MSQQSQTGSGCLFKFWLFLQKQASNTQLGLGFVFQAGRQTLEDQHEDQQLSVEEHEEWGPPETGKTTTTMRTKTTTAKTTQKQGCTSQLRVSSSKHFRSNMRTNNTMAYIYNTCSFERLVFASSCGSSPPLARWQAPQSSKCHFCLPIIHIFI